MPDHRSPEGLNATTVTITVGTDGRIYWHEVTTPVLEIASALCPQDAGLRKRLAVIDKKEDDGHDRGADGA